MKELSKQEVKQVAGGMMWLYRAARWLAFEGMANGVSGPDRYAGDFHG
ncbi:hypothetical protein [Microbulbifer mangrovi]|nr:hypothetical protein [Microbulbifer mangrovi]